MATHPDLAAEQAYIDRAYDCLERARQSATKLRSMVEVGKGGTEQARWEREIIEGNIANRLDYLHLGDASLVFGRIDKSRTDGGDTFYIGRVAVADESQEPLVVDWRAPVAEPFYRATGRAPMGLVRRRHFATRGRQLLGIEDELFGEGAGMLDGEFRVVDNGDDNGDEAREVRGHGALIAALEEARTGRLSDIVATIQGEQDEVIRSELPGVLVVQGGPGTGKTVVGLHRAAYLLYTHRFPLEGQGVLVVGPNRLFLGYIERVLPSLGEAGVELAVLADLIDDVRVSGYDRPATARIKGDGRMAALLAKAVRDRERGLRRALRVPFGLQTLVVPAKRTAAIVAEARRRFRLHNAGRRFVESQLFAALAEVSRTPTTPDEVRERLRLTPEVREALERMWPVLTPAELLHDLYGSRALIELAGNQLADDELAALERPRSDDVANIVWTHDDVPLLDEARALLGPKPRRRRDRGDADEIRTYGHIVVDEAQDLSPMQLRMLTRRSLNGSMTVVGDIAQATGVWAHSGWDEILAYLPDKRPSRRAELTIGYRIPKPTMDLAARVLAVAAPELEPPDSVRQQGDPPRIVQSTLDDLADRVARVAAEERNAVDPGSVAVIAPQTLVEDVARALDRAGIEYGRAARNGLEAQVTLVPVSLVKGLELDAAVVVGGGHNALVAAAYLGRAGLSVCVLERADHLGGAAVSGQVFAGVDARLSRYSYLVSLLPDRIVTDLGLRLTLASRRVASFTPVRREGRGDLGLLVERRPGAATAESFRTLTGSDREYAAWCDFYSDAAAMAEVVAPTLLEPLPSAGEVRRRLGHARWERLVDRPLGVTLEDTFEDDTVRGVVLTDALIGTFASAHEPTLRQNCCFLYHLMGNGTGEWRVPVGGMGAVTAELERTARAAGADLVTGTEVMRVDADGRDAEVAYVTDGGTGEASRVAGRFVLAGVAPAVFERLRGRPGGPPEGAQVKMNMVLERLPRLRSGHDPAVAFAGTFHIDEGYAALESAHAAATAGRLPDPLPSEVYCHTLTDPSILGPELAARGMHTLTLFGLQTPARLFAGDHGGPVLDEAVRRHIAGLDAYLAEPLAECLARDADDRPCLEAVGPGDLESGLAMPGGHIFHGDLSWPWVDSDDADRWGVATDIANLLLCGAGARRGGGVSGIGGHNAAMAVLERSR